MNLQTEIHNENENGNYALIFIHKNDDETQNLYRILTNDSTGVLETFKKSVIALGGFDERDFIITNKNSAIDLCSEYATLLDIIPGYNNSPTELSEVFINEDTCDCDNEANEEPNYPIPRDKVLSGQTTCSLTGCGYLFVTVNKKDDMPYEIFTQRGKSMRGGCGYLKALSRMISLGLRYGVPVDEMVSQLKTIKCMKNSGKNSPSCPQVIAKALKQSFAEKSDDNE